MNNQSNATFNATASHANNDIITNLDSTTVRTFAFMRINATDGSYISHKNTQPEVKGGLTKSAV